MIKSMTGYGHGESTMFNRKFMVEIKSVNHRYQDISIKIPRILTCFEEKLKKQISNAVSRGKTDVYVSYETFSKDDVKITVNEALADAYVDQLQLLLKRYHLLEDKITLPLISKFPDIITVEKGNNNEKAMSELWQSLSEALEKALKQFVSMRQTEGAVLQKDMLLKLKQISAFTHNIEERAPLVAIDHREKMIQRIKDVLNNQDIAIDEARILTEVAIFADKSCIDEEIIRLKSHLNLFPQILEETETVGRKLDFLLQEMNREVNTIGSKSNDVEITKTIVSLKSEIEKIREQVQNIE